MIRVAAAFVLGGVFGLLVFAPQAKADEYTDQFVATEAGVAVCEYFDKVGVSVDNIVEISNLAMEDLNMTSEQSGRFLRDSVDVYCPEHTSELVRAAIEYQRSSDRLKLA